MFDSPREQVELDGPFAPIAARLVAEVEAADLAKVLDVFLLCEAEGDLGELHVIDRVSVAPQVKVSIPQNHDMARFLAAATFLDGICGNIRSLLRGAPTEPITLADGQSVRVVDYRLEFEHC